MSMSRPPSHERPPSRRASSALSSLSSYLPLAIIVIIFVLSSRFSAAAASSICPPSSLIAWAKRPTTTSATMATAFPRGGGEKTMAAPTSVAASSTPSIARLVAGPFGSFARAVVDSRSHLAAAACARALSIFGMYPVDTIKTRMQMGRPFELSGLYRGVAGSLAGQVPYGVLTFGSYEMYKKSLLERFPDVKPAFVYALSAILGDVTGSGWLCPSEVVKQQLQAGMYGNTMEAISGIWRGGGLGGFYRGYTGGLARDVPFRVAQLTTFEVTKNVYLRAKKSRIRRGSSSSSSGGDVSLSALEAAACGAVAGSFSAAITNPLDRIKTLMMTDVTNAYGGSVAACASRIVRDEGFGGLFAGVVPRVAYIAPSVCIFFATYELVQQRMRRGVSSS